MADVAEHDTKEKRERYNGEEPWVHFPVPRDAVNVDDLLESVSEIILFKEGRRSA